MFILTTSFLRCDGFQMSSPASREWTAARPKRLMGKKNSRPEAAERICKLLEELTGNKENRIIDLEIIQ